MEEIVIYENALNGVRITNARAFFSGTTYSISNISSIRQSTETTGSNLAYYITGGLLILFGLLFLISETYSISVLLLIVGCILLLVAVNHVSKQTYQIVLTTNSGEIRAFKTESKELATEVLNALNEAIVHRE